MRSAPRGLSRLQADHMVRNLTNVGFDAEAHVYLAACHPGVVRWFVIGRKPGGTVGATFGSRDQYRRWIKLHGEATS